MNRIRLNKILTLQLIAVTIIPVVFAGAILYAFFSSKMKEELIHRNNLLAESIAGEVERYMHEPLNIMSHISRNISSGIVKTNLINAYLTSVISDYRYFELLQIIESNGRIEYIAPYSSDYIGNSVITGEYKKFINFTDRKNSISISPAFISFQSGRTTVAISSLFKSKILTGYMNLDTLQSITGRIALKNGYAFITDLNGTVIAHPDRNLVNERVSLSYLEPVEKGLQGKNGVYYYQDKGTDYAACVVKNMITGMLVVVVQPVSEVFGPLVKLRLLSLFGITIITIVSFFVGKQVILRSFRPVQALAVSTRRVAAGDYDITFPESKYLEIAEIWDNFSEMINSVKKREDDLKEARNYLKTIFNVQGSILISVKGSGIIEQYNNAASQYTGKNSFRLKGESLWEVFPFLVEHRSEMIQIINGDDVKSTFEIVIPEKHKRFFRVSCYSSTFKEEKMGLIRIDDISELKNKEEQLFQIQKMETIGTLAGGLAHDFNNVLGGITGILSLIDFKLEKNEVIESSVMKNYLTIMKNAGSRANEMINQLLALSRKQVLSFSANDLNDIIASVFTILETSIDKSITLEILHSDTPAIIRADTGRLEQVLLNLCVNAAHSMTIMRQEDEEWGGILTVSVEKVHPIIIPDLINTDTENKEYWNLSVTDTGIGIENEILSKIFDPFFTTKKKGEGIGLGLSMVYGIVEQHNGFINVYSETGVGTRINLYFPSLKSGVETDSVARSNFSVKTGDGLILIIDDEKIIRDVTSDILFHCGYKVILAENGIDGLHKFVEMKDEIRAVILDMSMPSMSGKEVYMKLREIKSDVKVLLFSGFRHDERVEEIMKYGITGFLQKPPTVENLSEAIYYVINS